MQLISLFSGIGGFELAAEWMGWDVVASCEINPFGRRVLKHYWPDAYHHDDIHTLTYETLKTQSRWDPTRPTILTGGFPCQPYSMAGKRRGKEDDRHLWPEMLRVIREVRPNYIVGENVLGLVSWDGGLVFDEVHTDLEREGYEVQAVVIPAAAVNAPHGRDRVWFCARRIAAYAKRIRPECRQRQYGVQRTSAQQPKQAETYCAHGENWTTPHTEGNGSGGKLHNMESTNGEKRQPEEQHKSEPTAWNFSGQRPTTNTESKPSERLRSEQREFSETEQGEFRGNGGGMGYGPTTHTDSNGQQRSDCEYEKQPSEGGQYAQRDIEQIVATDTHSTPPQQRHNSTEKGRGRQDKRTEPLGGSLGKEFPRTDWSDFPTQSPIRNVNDGIPGIMVRNIKKEIYATISERYTNKDLQEVWDALQSEEIRDKIGRLYKIHEPGLLLQTMQLCASPGAYEIGSSVFSEEASKDLMRKLQNHKTFANTPHGRELEKQFAEQFGNALPYLSHEIALVTMEAERASRKFSSWHRNESIKAAGNAIVPQVAYAIFRCIQSLHH